MNREVYLNKPKSLAVDLEVIDSSIVPRKVQIIDLAIEMKTLGVFIAPDGSSTIQFNILLSKAQKWARALRIHSLPKEELFASINSSITKLLEYPLVVTTFSEQEC